MSKDMVCKVGTLVNVILIIILDVLKLLDILTTFIGLNLGAIEMNPLFSYLTLFFILFLGSLVVLNIMVFLVRKNKTFIVVILVCLFILVPFNAYVITNNVLVILKLL